MASDRRAGLTAPYRYEVHPESHSVIPIAQFNPGYNPAFLDYSSSDFPDIDWVSPKTYLGTQSGTIYWVFKQGDDGTMAWIDLTTRLPARWQRGNEIRVFKFLPPPTEPLQLPRRCRRPLRRLETDSGVIQHGPRASIRNAGAVQE
jgi:hypothetical protein